jgi:RNA polymerase sigma factor (sigma-70 family)
MVWQDIVLFPGPHVDVEQEREARLAAQARAGADWALSALIARYQPVVIRYLTRLTGDSMRAAILAERIFVRMERRIRGPHGAQHLRLWLLRASTETGLDMLRNPHRIQPPRLQGGSPRGLIAERASSRTTQRLRESLNRITGLPGSTSRQVRPLVWSGVEGAAQEYQADVPPLIDDELDRLDPREVLRHKLVRAVLAELPYGDAQCLALHLVAGLNQAEVAQALGIRPSAARRRIVQGLQLFARRYEAALASLGITADITFEERGDEEEPVSSHEVDRGEDLVIPRAAASPRYEPFEPEEDMIISAERPAWPRPPQPEPMDTPQASMHAQSAMPHSVITMEVPPDPDTDGVESSETLADEEPHEPRAIPVAESAIVGPIVDAVPVAAADILSPARNDFQEQDTQTLSYTILVEQPHVVEAALPAETPAATMSVSWSDANPGELVEGAIPAIGAEDADQAAAYEETELTSEPESDAGARVVPVLSSAESVTALVLDTSPRQRPSEQEAGEVADETARLIPVLSHEHEDGDLHHSI